MTSVSARQAERSATQGLRPGLSCGLAARETAEGSESRFRGALTSAPTADATT